MCFEENIYVTFYLTCYVKWVNIISLSAINALISPMTLFLSGQIISLGRRIHYKKLIFKCYSLTE